MSKHTAGPWIIVDEGFLGIEIHSANARDLADAPMHYAIARDIGGRRHGDHFDDYNEVDANARLIAAAPDLLEALSTLMNMDVKGHRLRDRLQFSTPGREILDKCNSAITKATGESQ